MNYSSNGHQMKRGQHIIMKALDKSKIIKVIMRRLFGIIKKALEICERTLSSNHLNFATVQVK